LPRLGHRNWIAVVDAAYPEMIAPGVTTLVGGSLAEILKAVEAQPHLRPEAFLDEELFHLTDVDVPGVQAERALIQSLLTDIPTHRVLHERIIALLDEAARTFRVLIVKTKSQIPYSSVFLRLDCGYWSAESETHLRERMIG
jgi:hypothetical protein